MIQNRPIAEQAQGPSEGTGEPGISGGHSEGGSGTTWRPPSTLPERARWARVTSGLSVGQAAQAVSVPPRFLDELEGGADEAGMMRVHLLAHLPGLYGVDARWFMTGVPPVTEEQLASVRAQLTGRGLPEPEVEELVFLCAVAARG